MRRSRNDVFPCATGKHVAYGCAFDSEFDGELSKRESAIFAEAYRVYDAFGQLGHSVDAAASRPIRSSVSTVTGSYRPAFWVSPCSGPISSSLPAFRVAVRVVLCARRQKQMFRIYACGVVATMANAETVRNRSEHLDPGKAMGHFLSISDPKTSMAEMTRMIGPTPAFRPHSHFRPEPTGMLWAHRHECPRKPKSDDASTVVGAQ